MNIARKRCARRVKRLPRRLRFPAPKKALEEATGVDVIGVMHSHWSCSCQPGGYSGIGGGGTGIKLVESLDNLLFGFNFLGWLEAG